MTRSCNTLNIRFWGESVFLPQKLRGMVCPGFKYRYGAVGPSNPNLKLPVGIPNARFFRVTCGDAVDDCCRLLNRVGWGDGKSLGWSLSTDSVSEANMPPKVGDYSFSIHKSTS